MGGNQAGVGALKVGFLNRDGSIAPSKAMPAGACRALLAVDPRHPLSGG
jgi:hypothetical protein